jgi:hypothetical protein
MSALPPKADIDERECDVRFVPEAEVTGAIRPPRRWQARFQRYVESRRTVLKVAMVVGAPIQEIRFR